MQGLLKNFKNIISILGKYKKSFRFGYAAAVMEQFAAFVPYILLFYIIKIGLERDFVLRDFYLVSSVMAASVVLRILFKRLQDTLQQDKGYQALAGTRLDVTGHLEKLNMGYYREGNLGNMSSVITTDISFIEEFGIFQMGLAVTSLIGILFSVIFLFLFDYRIAIFYVIFSILCVSLLNRLLKRQENLSRNRQDNLAALSHAFLTFVKGMQVIKAFNMKREKNGDMESKIEEAKRNSLNMIHTMGNPLLAFELATAVSSALMIVFIGYLMITGNFSVAYGIGFIVFSFNIFLPITMLGLSSEMLSVTGAGIDRLNELMAEGELEDKKDSSFQPEKMNIHFKNVSFGYEEKDVLKNINLKIQDKTFTALVGKSGSGKTTMVNLLSRFWDIESGEILIDGMDIRDISFETLLSNISMVFQRVYLFHDTIYNNIAFGRVDASREDVINAAKKARCHDFIMNLEQGYETVVGEGGSTLSGGEKQRISIARAMLKDASIVLLDEATVGIDPENERFIQEAIEELVKDKTLIVIAHRLSSIKGADTIAYLEDGKIIEQGSHQELLEKNGAYKRQFDFYMKNKANIKHNL